ncbi:MAG TPA: hypothetical protein PKC24_06355 [Cyclobacteriaceae bacterium]|nr:hypothetical protein [Cyclobacteriaceae bacterium]
MEQVDKIFNERLKQHEMPVSADAWQKLAAGMQEKSAAKQNGKTIYFWMRIAAGFILLALAAAYVFLRSTASIELDVMPIAQNELKLTEEEIALTNTEPVAIAETQTENQPVIPQPNKNSRANTNTAAKSQSAITQIETLALVEETEIVLAQTEQIITKPEKEIQTAQSISQLAQPISINIVLSGKATETESMASVMYEEDQKNGFGSKMKNFLSKARDFKNSEGALADLRMAKDDFFTLELKKETNKRLEP